MDDISMLKNVQLFASMDEQELDALRTVMGEQRFVPGQVIIRQGEPGDHFHVITDGRVQFSTVDADAHELPLGDAGPGAFFGELSMLTGE